MAVFMSYLDFASSLNELYEEQMTPQSLYSYEQKEYEKAEHILGNCFTLLIIILIADVIAVTFTAILFYFQFRKALKKMDEPVLEVA